MTWTAASCTEAYQGRDQSMVMGMALVKFGASPSVLGSVACRLWHHAQSATQYLEN